MNGGIRKRGNTWSYYFDMGKVDGKRKRKEKGGFATKRECQAALAKALSEYNQAGLIFEPSEITVADYLDQWYDLHCKLNLKYNTQVGYLRIIETHLKPRFGLYKLRSLNATILQEYANYLKVNCGYSKSHIVGILTVLSAALDYAIEPLHYITQNPMDHIKYPAVQKKKKEKIILTVDEWEKIINRFTGTRYYLPLLIGFYTGMRISEVFALTWDDIDFDNKTISVNKQVVKRNFGADVRKVVEKKGKKELRSSWYFTTTKTNSSIRSVKFGDTLCKALKEEKAKQLQNELQYGEYYTIHVLKKELDEKGDDMIRIVPVQKCVNTPLTRCKLICIADNGQYTSTDSFKYASRVIHNELHLAFDFHSLRHTHATILIEAGANVKNVQARLGHATIRTTLETYVHDTEVMAEQSVELFEQKVKKA